MKLVYKVASDVNKHSIRHKRDSQTEEKVLEENVSPEELDSHSE